MCRQKNLPEDQLQQKLDELTEPYFPQVGKRGLAFIRAFNSLFFTVLCGIVIIFSRETFWMFLTNWVHIACCPTYIMLTIVHYQNGDFKKQSKQSIDM